MLFSEMQLLVSDKLKRETSAKHNGRKILWEKFYQESVVVVLWRQSSGALQNIIMLDDSIQRASIGICMHCAMDSVLFNHAFL